MVLCPAPAVSPSFLFPTNVSGHDAFGALSAEVQGQADLNPVLTLDTRVDDLNGGAGVTPGSFAISDGNSISVIDINGAETVRDIVELIESHPPEGRVATARRGTSSRAATRATGTSPWPSCSSAR